ncbi:MAG: 2-phosphosulfolactate phosphatase [Actinomycetota bacterium]|nr:2-phosphosulfolactate phosphatase [Actinomycetota bacterium]
MTGARFSPRWEVGDASGAVVVVDVLRAFTTAAYAFGAGVAKIHLVSSVDEALDFKAAHPGVLAMGEDGGCKPSAFDFSNSPVEIAAADVAGRVLVQRTSAGTQGVFAARAATRLWCASLVCASATAAAVRSSGLGAPTYVITGRFADLPEISGSDDLATAELIERARLGQQLGADRTRQEVATSDEARRTLALGAGHVHPDDIAYATDVDRFAFAMEATRVEGGPVRLLATSM